MAADGLSEKFLPRREAESESAPLQDENKTYASPEWQDGKSWERKGRVMFSQQAFTVTKK